MGKRHFGMTSPSCSSVMPTAVAVAFRRSGALAATTTVTVAANVLAGSTTASREHRRKAAVAAARSVASSHGLASETERESNAQDRGRISSPVGDTSSCSSASPPTGTKLAEPYSASNSGARKA